MADLKRSAKMKTLALLILAIIATPCSAKLDKVVSTEAKPKYVFRKTTWSRDGKVIFESAVADRGAQGVLTINRYWADDQVVYFVIHDGKTVNRVMTGAKGVTISEVESPLPSERGLLITSKSTGYLEYFVGDDFMTPASDSELASKKELDRALTGLVDGAYEGSAIKMEKELDSLKAKEAEKR